MEEKTNRVVRFRIRTDNPLFYKKMYAQTGACRFIWNHVINRLQEDYKKTGKCEFYFFSVSKDVAKLRNQKETEWLKEYSSATLVASLRSVEVQYKKFFKNPKKEGLPKFKSKFRSPNSFPLASGQGSKLSGDELWIPKVGWVKLMGKNNYPDGIFRGATIKEENGKWFAYVCFEITVVKKREKIVAVGVDRNAGQITLSDGTVYTKPCTKRLQSFKEKYQRTMSRRQKPNRKKDTPASGRYLVARKKFINICAKIKKTHDTWLHQITRDISDRFNCVVLEDLNIKGMTGSAKGDMENPGTNVKAKSGLNKVILETNWYKLEQLLSYKSTVIKVPAHYTSQMCCQCGHTEKENRKKDKFKCKECGYKMDADLNASLNILASLRGVTGRRATTMVEQRSVKKV